MIESDGYEAGVPAINSPVRLELGLLHEQIVKHDKIVRRLLDRLGPITGPGSQDDKIARNVIEAAPDRAHSELALMVQGMREGLEATTYAIDDALARLEV
jgi:hypothetical protein